MKSLVLLLLISFSIIGLADRNNLGHNQAGTQASALMNILDKQSSNFEISVDRNGQIVLNSLILQQNCEERWACSSDSDCGGDGYCGFRVPGPQRYCTCE